MELTNVQVGSEVAVLLYRARTGEWEPNRLNRVNKVTAKRIHLSLDYQYDLTGKPVSRIAQGSRITTDKDIVQSLLDEREAARIEREARERAIQERDARKTYQLASEIVASWNKDPVADLELLGEEKLQEIVDLIAKAKAEVAS